MSLPSPVTPAEAKALWDRMDHPSARRVATALTQSGRPVHFSTVARWRLQGWRSVVHDPHPVEMARRALDVALPVLTGDATMSAADFVKADPAAKEIMTAATEKALSMAVREACIVHILVAKAFCRHPELILTKSGEVAVLLNALNASMRAINNLHVQVLDVIRAQDEARASTASKG
jgi:hypothetical protein